MSAPGIKVISEDAETIQLVMPYETEIVNSVRRILKTNIPSYAIDPQGESFKILQNDTLTPDYILADTVSLIPLNIDYRNIAADETVLFELRCTAGETPHMVLSSQLISTTHPHLRPVYEDIPIAMLPPKGMLFFKCTAIRGTEADHARFQHCTVAIMRPIPTITVHSSVNQEVSEFVHRECPSKVFDIENGHLIVARPTQCTLCRACYRNEHKPRIIVDYKEDEPGCTYFVEAESQGILPVRTLVTIAIQMHNQRNPSQTVAALPPKETVQPMVLDG